MAIYVHKLVCSHSVISDTHYERLQTPRAPNTMTGLVTKSSYQTNHAPHYEFWGVGCWFRRTACAQNSNVAHREGRQTHFASWPRCVCVRVQAGTPAAAEAGQREPWHTPGRLSFALTPWFTFLPEVKQSGPGSGGFLSSPGRTADLPLPELFSLKCTRCTSNHTEDFRMSKTGLCKTPCLSLPCIQLLRVTHQTSNTTATVGFFFFLNTQNTCDES